jgi:aryl-alcohol dehydrogenase-like predicted oxidoreductase
VSDGAERLGLGTAQFGLPYGLTNIRGQVTRDEVKTILSFAQRSGMTVIDTAHEYGESEAAIGSCRDVTSGFRIITKTPSLGPERIDAEQVSSVWRAIDNSRRALRRDRLDGLLVHNGQALLLPGGDRVIALLQEAKAKGLVAGIGVSVFDPAALEAILAIFVPDLVQVPLNLLDQRFLSSGLIAALAANAIEIHVRSVLLQGLLLADPQNLPDSMAPARRPLDAVRRFCAAHGLTPLVASLRFAMAQPEIRHIIVGVTGVDELAAIVAAARERSPDPLDFTPLAVDDLDIIAPARWRVPPVAWGNLGVERSR